MTRQRRDAAATTVSKTESQPVRPMARRHTELFPKEAACHPASPADKLRLNLRRTREFDEPSNGLLEPSHEQRLDTGAAGRWFFSAFTLTTFFAADVDTDTLAEVPSGTTAPLAFSCVQAYGAQGPKLRALPSSSVTSVSRSCANR